MRSVLSDTCAFSFSPAKVLINAPIQARTVLRAYDVTRDGKRFLVIENDSSQPTPSLILVLNFAEELKRLSQPKREDPAR